MHTKHTFTPAHFERWLDMFCETVDLGWAGADAKPAHAHATSPALRHGNQLCPHEHQDPA